MLAVAGAVLSSDAAGPTWLDLAFLLVAGGCAVWSWRTVPVAAVMLVPLSPPGPAARGAAPPRPDAAAPYGVLVAGARGRSLGALAAVVPHDRRRASRAAVVGRPGARLRSRPAPRC